MKTVKDLWEMAFDEWYYQSPHGYLIYVAVSEYTAANMAHLAAEMILEGRF